MSPLDLSKAPLPHAARMLACARATARAVIQPAFRGALEIQAKAHAFDLVTQTDEDAETRLRSDLAAVFPGALITGEERIGRHPHEKALLREAPEALLIDPIDGTMNFAQGVGLVGTILVRLLDGVPQAGVLYDPIADDAVLAEKGLGAWFWRPHGPQHWRRLDGTPATPVRAVLANAWKWRHDGAEQVARAVDSLGPTRSLMAAAHDHRSLALGTADCALFRDAQPWDHAAGALVLSEMGGRCAFLDGTPYHVGRSHGPLVAGRTPEEWERMAAALRDVIGATPT